MDLGFGTDLEQNKHKIKQKLQYFKILNGMWNLEALSVDNARAGLIILLLGDPHLLEGGERGKDGSSDPDRVLPLRGGNDLNLDGGWSKSSDLLLHSVSNTRVHGGTSGKDVVSVKILTDVNVALHDGVVGGFVDTSSFHTEEGWLEEGFWATESCFRW